MLTVQVGTITFMMMVSWGDIAFHCFGRELDVFWQGDEEVAGIHWNHADDHTRNRHWTWAEVREWLMFWRGRTAA